VPGLLSNRSNWLFPPPQPQSSVASPPPISKAGATHSLAGEGAGGANSDEGDRHSGTLGKIQTYLWSHLPLLGVSVEDRLVYGRRTDHPPVRSAACRLL
jgi:hypothetical protein